MYFVIKFPHLIDRYNAEFKLDIMEIKSVIFFTILFDRNGDVMGIDLSDNCEFIEWLTSEYRPIGGAWRY